MSHHVINLPTNRTDCNQFDIADLPNIPSFPLSAAIGINVLLAAAVLIHRKLLNRFKRCRKLAFAVIIFLILLQAFPSVLEALLSVIGYAGIYDEDYEALERLAKCLEGIIPKTINQMIPVIVVVVLRLAASIGEFIIVVFGLFEDYKFPRLAVKKSRLVACSGALIVATLLSSLILIRVRFKGFGCVYERQVHRYFCSTQETAQAVNAFFNVSFSELNHCDTLNTEARSLIISGSSLPQCSALPEKFPAIVQKHFQRVVRIGVSRAFFLASIATAVVSFLSVLANLAFVIFRLWKKKNLRMKWVLLSVFISGMQNSLVVFLFIRRHLDLLDFPRVIGCGCIADKSVLEWDVALQKLGGFIMSFSVAVTYSKVDEDQKGSGTETTEAESGDGESNTEGGHHDHFTNICVRAEESGIECCC